MRNISPEATDSNNMIFTVEDSLLHWISPGAGKEHESVVNEPKI